MISPTDRRPILLVVDDEPLVLTVVERFAQTQEYNVITRAGGHALLAELPSLKADAAIVDLQMTDVDGFQMLRAIREKIPTCEVILMTRHASVDSAIEAVKLGALDYLSKPLDLVRFGECLTTVRRGIARRKLLLAVDSEMASRFEFHGMIGRSAVMQELFDLIRRLAPHVRTALVTGETGTGKELVARALHTLGSRKEQRFTVCNCSAIVESLSETELFGHTRGAFTGAVEAKTGLFELSDGGTIFLDEIGELSLAMQPKLLRVIEYGEVQRVGGTESKKVDVHVVAATNCNLLDEVAAGRFRQDLYYRLNVVEILVPPLRDRREDIPYLAAAFVQEFIERFGKRLIGISPGAERVFQNAPWPGNVRELRNALERACMLADGEFLSERDLLSVLGPVGRPPDVAHAPGFAAAPQKSGVAVPDLDRSAVEQALQRAGGNKSAAARDLGVSRRAFYRRLDSLGLR